jgi:capsid assembly protein Gp20
MAITRFYKIISPRSANVDITDGQDIGGNRGLYGNYTWYNRLVQGSATRITRYREYDVMDADIDIARALDIVSEEMTGFNSKSNLPLQIEVTAGSEQDVKSKDVVTLNAALKTWCQLQCWDLRIRPLVRTMLKYGDVFFFRPKKKNKKWIYVNPKQVIGAVVSQDDVTEVKGWHIKVDTKKSQGNLGTNIYYNVQGNLYDQNVDVFNAEEVIRFTKNDDMSDEAPFGESILRTIFRTFKQKELLEDAVIIYRIVRAPERRVFYLETGNMPSHKVAAYLEQVKNEIREKKIPTMQGGKNQIESIYNPMSMQEDFFFAVNSQGKSSRVETLPGGQGLGELKELDYFYLKMWRGLRIPASYMGISTSEEGMSAFTDGAVGIALIQEILFMKYCEQLQLHVEHVMDIEFKKFLHDIQLNIDPTIFKVVLPAPTNWAKSKQNKTDSDSVNVYNSVKDDPSISPRFAQEKYLQLSKDEIKRNEYLRRQELGLDPNGGIKDLPKLYAPEQAEAGGFEGGLGSVGGAEGGEGELPELDEGEEGTENTEGTEAETGEGDEAQIETGAGTEAGTI